MSMHDTVGSAVSYHRCVITSPCEDASFDALSQVGTFLEEGPGNMQTLQRVGTGVVNTGEWLASCDVTR